MILDLIAHAARYGRIHSRLGAALAFAQRDDLAALPCGRHDVEGDALYALVQEYETRPLEACRWEAHRRYIDVQIVLRGAERMGWTPLSCLHAVDPYDSDRDVEFLREDCEHAGAESAGTLFTVRPGMFAVFFPQDAHMPQVALASPTLVKKLVIKVAVAAS